MKWTVSVSLCPTSSHFSLTSSLENVPLSLGEPLGRSKSTARRRSQRYNDLRVTRKAIVKNVSIYLLKRILAHQKDAQK
jgi:hypothetical protein